MAHRALIERHKRAYAFKHSDTTIYDYNAFLPVGAKDEKRILQEDWISQTRSSINVEIQDNKYNCFSDIINLEI